MANNSFENFGKIVPGITIGRFAHSKYFYARIYDKTTRSYLQRSTGLADLEQAKAWIMANLSELFQQKATPRGGGNTSIIRLLSSHMAYHERRRDADEIAPSTFLGYSNLARHFVKWFPANGYKRLTDIKRTALQEYAINRVNQDGLAVKSANQEVMFLRMWWSWMQSKEILNRPIDIPKIRQRVGSRTSTEPFEKNHLKEILDAVDEFANSNKGNVSKYNREVFRCFVNLLEQSGCRTHEVLELTWAEMSLLVRREMIKR